MAASIIEAVRRKLGLSPLHKVDPNLQETKGKEIQSSGDNLAQAALPAVMAALFRKSRTEDGVRELMKDNIGSAILPVIFAGQDASVVSKVARYASVSEQMARFSMERIAAEGLSVLKGAVGQDRSYSKVEHYMNGQRHDILIHLPAALKMGEILNDETLDDRTNKMEGPVSTFMNRLGDVLADGEQTTGTF